MQSKGYTVVANSVNLVFANAPKKDVESLLFPLVLIVSAEGVGEGHICKGWGQAWASRKPSQPTPRDGSWSGHRARPPGRGRKLQCLLLLTKERSGGQNVFKGEVAKIITRVWEENQGVARPQRRLGGSTVDGGNMLQPAKLQPWGATSWERHCPSTRGAQRALGGELWVSLLLLRAIDCLEVQGWRGNSGQPHNKGGKAGPQRESRMRTEAQHLLLSRPGLLHSCVISPLYLSSSSAGVLELPSTLFLLLPPSLSEGQHCPLKTVPLEKTKGLSRALLLPTWPPKAQTHPQHCKPWDKFQTFCPAPHPQHEVPSLLKHKAK